MNKEFLVIPIIILVMVIGGVFLGIWQEENTRACKMEAAAKGYNVKEICE